MEASQIEVIKDQTFQKIHEIEGMLLKNDPALPGHLAAIHKTMISYEDLPHLLSDEQIHILIKGQTQVTGTVLVQSSAKQSKASITKAAKGITAADL